MIKSITVFVFLVLTAGSMAQVKSVAEFQKEVAAMEMTFEMPEGFKPIAVKENRDLSYTFAIINEAGSMEVRYTLWPIGDMMERYEESLKDSNSVMVHPNKIYMGRLQANVLNMTGGNLYDIGPFPPNAVRKEFNADTGGSSFFPFNCEFGEGYTFGQFVYLHKDGVGEAVITYMSNDKSTHSDLMMGPFHALKFKD